MESNSGAFTDSFALLLSPVKELAQKLQVMPSYTNATMFRVPSMDDLPLLFKNTRSVAILASVLVVAYVAITRHIRFRRVRAIERKYAKRIEAARAKVGEEGAIHELHLSPREAQEILLVSHKYDHTTVLSIGRALGLYKTYAIPSVAKLLYATGQFGTSSGSRRIADTSIAIDTWIRCPLVGPTEYDLESETNGHSPKDEKQSAYHQSDSNVDPRNALAIARVNWLHSRYKIKNDDYLFTMSSLLFEPIELANKYGWRKITPLEEEAYFVYWKEIGRRMGIKNIPDSIPELKKWTESYAQEHAVPNESSRKLAKAHLDQVVLKFPPFFGIRSLVRSLFQSIFDERTRRALGFPTPPGYIVLLQKAIGNFISFKNGYVALPWNKVEGITPDKVDEKVLKETLPRLNANRLRSTKEPWYVAEPTGLAGILFRVRLHLGLEDPTYAPGPKYKSQGYRLEEIGPVRLENDGHDEVMKIAASIQGCPVVGPWAR